MENFTYVPNFPTLFLHYIMARYGSTRMDKRYVMIRCSFLHCVRVENQHYTSDQQ